MDGDSSSSKMDLGE